MELVARNKQAIESDVAFAATVEEHFSSLGMTAVTMTRFIFMDSVGDIYRSLIKYDWTLVFYFSCIVLSVPIVLMNLITAIIVNAALEQADKDKTMKQEQDRLRRASLIDELKELFTELDEDGSAEISPEEIMNASDDVKRMLLEITHLNDLDSVFMELYREKNKSKRIEEFCEGISKIAFSEVPAETRLVKIHVEELHADFCAFKEQFQSYLAPMMSRSAAPADTRSPVSAGAALDGK
eukprot:gnl/TRDRNA2_/TRDRNA2_147491_c0_seq1.p1 gnl/TRDRNA2_/TRDRNA2_147491_c0~~gnl/TRDRNA2_/TRDRNA2_147491_c0_seq1.p1  ORF type:complete len:263 (+),score=53.36 gnl/TRDRNA2_/TRDRNA2_147491_c0_seq1:73-789(+)